jgi:hypothetical protein
MAIDGYFINGCWWLFVVINGYYISGYWCLFYTNGYEWLLYYKPLVVILLIIIYGYSIGGHY